MRVALVTGGTAGIGAAAAEALHGLGYRVAVNYGRNQQAAEVLSARTGIPTFEWNVADLAASEAGVARVQDMRLARWSYLSTTLGLRTTWCCTR